MEAKHSKLIFPTWGKTQGDVQEPGAATFKVRRFPFAWEGGHWPSFSPADTRARWKGLIDRDVKANLQMFGNVFNKPCPFIYIYTFAWILEGEKNCEGSSEWIFCIISIHPIHNASYRACSTAPTDVILNIHNLLEVKSQGNTWNQQNSRINHMDANTNTVLQIFWRHLYIRRYIRWADTKTN